MDLLPEYYWTKDPFDKLRMTTRRMLFVILE